ncbi:MULTISPECIES: hypothetical protein [unclassified Neptuniibacter]|uniref:L,D-transpeptidase Cds6 family protein n=1 Tax=unclassified Neptuniibacter TaxID=2630693 RepID=UPI000C4A65DB|nr:MULTISPECIES: hypothetical protein [unclassified Neptuniibacter]MAY41401.1 hypothetical protein [Oceanospirillaceae bacterium]|tara:strand:- start:7101 stop:8540 length:1440 start_codon:yes stop_codon:yes gene_type:complete
MTDSGMSSAELLLSNLNDHQVIRIEGRVAWMTSLVGLIKEDQPDHIEFTGELTLQGLQAELADYLSVEPGASFIQQALKLRLAAGNKLLLIVNSEEVDTQALTYLLGLPSICDEEGSAVTVLLLSTPDLLSALKSTPSLAAKLDGYYQEDKDDVATTGLNINKTAVAAAVSLLVIGIGGWYMTQQSSIDIDPPSPNLVNTDSSSKESASVAQNSVKEPQKELLSQQEIASESIAGGVVESTTGTVESPSVESKLEPVAVTVHEASTVEGKVDANLAADLAATIEQAKAKKSGEAKILTVTAVEANTRKTNVSTEPSSKNIETALRDNPTPEMPKIRTEEAVPPMVFKPVKSVASLNNEAEVRKVVDNWGKAWKSQDWESYIGSYVQHTNLYGVKMSIEEWRAFRKKRLLTPEWIKLELGKPKYTRLNTHWYRVEFYQRFEKPGYADETTKRLELTLTSYGWKIASEAADGTIVLKRPGG